MEDPKFYSLPSDKVDALCAAFEDAEQQLKAFENDEDGRLEVPSVNQLRYVGYHVLNALTRQSLQEQEKELDKAINHAQRALYDAYEAKNIDALALIDKFVSDYRVVQVTSVVKNYAALKSEVLNIRDELKIISKDNNKSARYKKIGEMGRRLGEIGRELEASRDDLNSVLNDRRITSFRWFVTIIISVLLAVIGWVVVLLKDRIHF